MNATETITQGQTLLLRLDHSLGTLGDLVVAFPAGAQVGAVRPDDGTYQVRAFAAAAALLPGFYSLPITATVGGEAVPGILPLRVTAPLGGGSFLPAEELADLNGDLEGTFDSMGQVLRPTPTRDSQGGTTEAYVPQGNPVPCACWQDQQRIEQEGGEITSVSAWKLSLPTGVDVRAGDQVQIGALLLLVSGTDSGYSDAIGQLLDCKRVG